MRIILTLIRFYETSNKRNSTDYDHRESSLRTKITVNCIYLLLKLMKETEIHWISSSVAARWFFLMVFWFFLFSVFSSAIFFDQLEICFSLTISPCKRVGKKTFSSRGFPAVQDEKGQMTKENNKASKQLPKWTLSLDENKIRFN